MFQRLVLAAIFATTALAQQQLSIKEFPIPQSLGGTASGLGQIVNGSDGAMWFTGTQTTKVGRITTAGVISQFPLPIGFTNPAGVIVAGPDGALWFPMSSGSTLAIAQMTTSGTVTQFVIDTTGLLTVGGMTVGNDGAIYLTEALHTSSQSVQTARLGRITTAGVHTFVNLSIPNVFWGPLAEGPDGNFWSNGSVNNAVDVFRVAPNGTATSFPFSATSLSPGPNLIPGPDGALWFPDWEFAPGGGVDATMIRVTTSGIMTDFLGAPPAFSVARTSYVARGPDGAFWFGGDDGLAIGCCGYLARVTALGAFTVYNQNVLPAGITAGPDGAMWFVDRLNVAIGRFEVPTTSLTSTLPHFAAQNVWTTGIFAINTGNAPANFEVDFQDDAGAPASLPFAGNGTNKLTGMLPAQGSAYFETGNPSGPLISGWGHVTADAPVVIQSLFRENSNGLYYEAAVPSNIGSVEFLIPFDATTFTATGDPLYTGFAIANQDPLNPSLVTCTARDQTGATIPNVFTAATGPPILPPLGHWAGYLFPALTGMRGTIDCSAGTLIAATALRFIGTNAFSSLPVIDKRLASSLIPGVALPHFAAQDVWTTGIFAINTNTSAANFSVAFYDDNGNPIALPFTSGATNTLSGSLPANGSAYLEASNPKATLIDGWGSITADPGVVIQALFRENASGKYFEAAVPASTGSAQFEIPFDATTFAATGDQFFTGFAIANLDTSNPATITCTARDNTGSVIPNAFTATTGPPQLRPLGHWAGYLFPALTGLRGTIDCSSTTVIAATALRFIGGNAFSSLPVITK
jgi:virginiamycin B lyase